MVDRATTHLTTGLPGKKSAQDTIVKIAVSVPCVIHGATGMVNQSFAGRKKGRQRKMKVETSLEKMTIFQCNSKTKRKTIHKGEPFEHHIYENKWISRPSKPHPTLMAHLKPLPEDHISFGHPLKTMQR